MEPKKSSSVSWLMLGAIFMLALVGLGFLESEGIVNRYSNIHYFSTMILGVGGSLFLIVGILKVIFSKFGK